MEQKKKQVSYKASAGSTFVREYNLNHSDDEDLTVNFRDSQCEFSLDVEARSYYVNEYSSIDKFLSVTRIRLEEVEKLIFGLNRRIKARNIIWVSSFSTTTDNRIPSCLKFSIILILLFLILTVSDVYYFKESLLTYIGTVFLVAALVVLFTIIVCNADFRTQDTREQELPIEQTLNLKSTVADYAAQSAIVAQHKLSLSTSQDAKKLTLKVKPH